MNDNTVKNAIIQPKRITHVISSLKRGGAETVLVSLLNAPEFDEYYHTVIYFHKGPLVEQLHKKNINLFHVPYSFLFPFRFFYCFFLSRPDYVHALLWNGITWGILGAWLYGVPSTAAFHNNINQNAWWKNYSDWFILRLSSHFVAVSEEVRLSVASYHRWLTPDRITVIHNGIEPVAENKCHDLKNVYKIPHDAIVIGMVARFEPVKRHLWLIEHLRILIQENKNIFLVLIGDGSQESAIRAAITHAQIENKTRIIMHQEARLFYPMFDIFTLTSSQEGVSLALLEAMSCAIPCVVTNKAVVHPVIEHNRDGFLIGSEDGEAYRLLIARLSDDAAFRRNIGVNAQRKVVEKFSCDTMVYNYKSLINADFY